MQPGLGLALMVNFHLSDETDAEMPIRSARSRALIAILATSRDRKRTRSWIQTCLWEASPEEQASGSLRQMLSMLRKELGERAALLEADRTYVAMPKLEAVSPRPGAEETFFEDAPDLGEIFEDWAAYGARGDRRSASLRTGTAKVAAGGPALRRHRIAARPVRRAYSGRPRRLDLRQNGGRAARSRGH